MISCNANALNCTGDLEKCYDYSVSIDDSIGTCEADVCDGTETHLDSCGREVRDEEFYTGYKPNESWGDLVISPRPKMQEWPHAIRLPDGSWLAWISKR